MEKKLSQLAKKLVESLENEPWTRYSSAGKDFAIVKGNSFERVEKALETR